MNDVKLSYPVKSWYITQGFGENPTNYTQFNMKGHNGLDFISTWGDKVVYAAADGNIAEVGNDPAGYGLYIKQRGARFYLMYGHFSVIYVKLNDKVKAGDPLGIMGWSGNVYPPDARGTHLHFGLKIDGVKNPGYYDYIDPLPYLTSQAEELFTDENNAAAVPESVEIADTGVFTVVVTRLNLRGAPSAESGVLKGNLSLGSSMPYIKVDHQSNGDVWLCITEKLWVAGKFAGEWYISF